MILKFRDENYYLSNFYEAPLVYNGIRYPSSECAYQAQKCLQRLDEFLPLKAGESKKLGAVVELREDWNDVKDQIMYEIVLAKFTQNPDLKQLLLSTGDQLLEEGNDWGDTYWGVCDGVGENKLGKILMQVRKELS